MKRYPRETLSWLGKRSGCPQHNRVLVERASTDTSKSGARLFLPTSSLD
jgi:hypothetical protein